MMEELIEEYKKIGASEALKNFRIDEYKKQIRREEIKRIILFISQIVLSVIITLVILSWIY